MVKKKIPKKKIIKDFTIDFKDPISRHYLTLNSAKKWLEQHIKSEDKIKLSKSSKNTLAISIDNTINFSKRHIRSLIKKFLNIKKAKYHTVRETSPNTLSVVAVK